MESAILTEGLVKVYRGKGKNSNKPVNALVNLRLDVKIGDIYGFIGPNGAGKTTTLKILMGLISQTSGKASVMGEEAGSVEAKRQVGYLSEIAYYYPFMEVGKLLDFYCSFYEIPRGDRKIRINEVLEMVSLSDKINSKISDLSKGMQQKFGIAQAIIANPPLLILDELTSGLDPIAQKEVKDIVLRLKDKGKTIFFSSHQMTEVEMICDQIGIINQGHMLKSANLEEFIREESGAMTDLVFDSESADFLSLFKEKQIDVSQLSKNRYRITIPDTGINEMIDMLRGKKMPVVEILPHRCSLEDAFFRLIKENGK